MILDQTDCCNITRCLYKTNYTVTEDQVNFYLHNRELGKNEQELTGKNLQQVNNKLPFVFLIHGYTRSHTTDWIEKATKEYLTKGDYNILQVDWSKPASQSYDISSNNTEPVGKNLHCNLTM